MDWVVTTEKDAVRLPEVDLGRPMWALEVELAGWGGAATLGEELDSLLKDRIAT